MSITFQQFWELATEEAARRGTKPEYVFAALGLHLMNPPSSDDRFRYDCTPLNVSVFGFTGGDGVHFSLLQTDYPSVDDAPVVMTVPMTDRENWIVGANLAEFLAIACNICFFQLETLPFKRPMSFDSYAPITEDSKEWELAQLIISEFELTPWNDLETRINELKQAYYHLLKFNDDDMENFRDA